MFSGCHGRGRTGRIELLEVAWKAATRIESEAVALATVLRSAGRVIDLLTVEETVRFDAIDIQVLDCRNMAAGRTNEAIVICSN